MAVIFGLDMKEMQWYKFGSKYMFGNQDYHLRRTKFIVYQLAMIFCVVSESLGTATLSDFVDSQKFLKKHSSAAVEHNNDYIGMASYNIFAGIFVAFVFGAAFFFDLFWPARHEDRGIRLAWKGCSVAACIFMFASIICEVVIVTTKAAYVTGVSPEEALRLEKEYGGYPLRYNKNGRAIASVVFAWLGFPCVVASTVIMWMSINYTERAGPYAGHVKWPKRSASSVEEGKLEKEEASEMNNVEGNHYEPPGMHVQGPNHGHYASKDLPERSDMAAPSQDTSRRTYDGT